MVSQGCSYDILSTYNTVMKFLFHLNEIVEIIATFRHFVFICRVKDLFPAGCKFQKIESTVT